MLPASEDVSEYEHPLTREELATMIQPFKVEGTRYFRLPSPVNKRRTAGHPACS